MSTINAPFAVITAATFEYRPGDGQLLATLANGEVWRLQAGRDGDVWVGHTADDYAPVSAEYFASYVASIAAGEWRKVDPRASAVCRGQQ